MAMASANAMAKIAIVCTFDAASGFLPIAFNAVDPIQPIEIAGNIVPRAIAPTTANMRIDSASIVKFLISNFSIFKMMTKRLNV